MMTKVVGLFSFAVSSRHDHRSGLDGNLLLLLLLLLLLVGRGGVCFARTGRTVKGKGKAAGQEMDGGWVMAAIGLVCFCSTMAPMDGLAGQGHLRT